MREKARPILVTGSHRSGTTWAGQMLCAAPGTAYLHEPFNPLLYPRPLGAKLPNWYAALDAGNAGPWAARIERLLALRLPLAANLRALRGPLDLARLARDEVRLAGQRLTGARPVVKDPIAFFSAPWLAQRFGLQVLVMIRHPAAFVSSLVLKDWRFDFGNFARQPALLEGPLAPYAAEIAAQAAQPGEQLAEAILLWNCIHHTAARYRAAQPGWQFVRHEDLSRDPLAGFRALYAAFGLAFTAEVADAIARSSGAHNPAEQGAGSEFVRDAAANIGNWQRRLSEAEIAQVRAGTEEVASQFYADSDW